MRDLVAREVITLKHKPGSIMIADVLTKAVARSIYLDLLKLFDSYSTDGQVCPTGV